MNGMELIETLEREIRGNEKLLENIWQIERIRRKHWRAKVQASDGFLHEELNHGREGASISWFFEGFKDRHRLNQVQCPKRFLFVVLRRIMSEVQNDA